MITFKLPVLLLLLPLLLLLLLLLVLLLGQCYKALTAFAGLLASQASKAL